MVVYTCAHNKQYGQTPFLQQTGLPENGRFQGFCRPLLQVNDADEMCHLDIGEGGQVRMVDNDLQRFGCIQLFLSTFP